MPDSPSPPGSVERRVIRWLMPIVLLMAAFPNVMLLYLNFGHPRTGSGMQNVIDGVTRLGLLCGILPFLVERYAAPWGYLRLGAVGAALGAVTGALMWATALVFGPSSPFGFLERVAGNAVVAGCVALLWAVGYADRERVRARLGGRA